MMSFAQIIHSLPAEEQRIIQDMMALFDAIDRKTQEFSQQTGLRCKDGCGACCENPDVETTVSEVLPLAAYLWSRDSAEGKLEDIRASAGRGVCVFYRPDPVVKGHGRCGIYAYRPGLCRLFGFAGRKDKHGRLQLMTCKVIKASQPQACQHVQENLQEGQAPLLTRHALNVADIDPAHGQKLMPINQAIGLAIEKIGYELEKLKQ